MYCFLLLFRLLRHETININLKDKPDWYFEKNPLGLVPTLETASGQVIYESPITCDYLDEVYAEKKLLPADPFEKAQQKMMLENFSKVCSFCCMPKHIYLNINYIQIQKGVAKCILLIRNVH